METELKIYTDSKIDMNPRSQIDSVRKQPPPETVVKFTYGRGEKGFANSTIAAHCSAVMDDSDLIGRWVKLIPTFASLSLSRQ